MIDGVKAAGTELLVVYTLAREHVSGITLRPLMEMKGRC